MNVQAIARVLLAVFFVLAGANHFRDPAFYLPLMPDYLPLHREIIFLTGVLEIVFGMLLVIPRYRHAAGISLMLLLAAIFPANVHMALHPEVYPEVSQLLRWGRLPLQAVFLAWVWWVT